ncbi:protein of unknown function [Vibrio tapetis subsp. tapetis]|uniref:Uncharacterized protein n=1 Tax=Vibrio tapetis subsp. tapetis TaxID=1671868 RepID=A0A2N8Z9W2_9VIBR|nr:protein of unknown function [Vibrio tapetis subsp. tapetis]
MIASLSMITLYRTDFDSFTRWDYCAKFWSNNPTQSIYLSITKQFSRQLLVLLYSTATS